MFSKRETWVPKTKPEGTVRVVTIKSSRPRTPATISHAPSNSNSNGNSRASSTSSTMSRKRPRSSDRANASASTNASRQSLAVPSYPRKKRVSPAAEMVNVFAESDSDPEDDAARPQQTIREDPNRDLCSHALKKLDEGGYEAISKVDFVHACSVVSISPTDAEGNGKKSGIKQAAKWFPEATDDESTVELQYPGSLTRERFHLVDQTDRLDVIKDIVKVLVHVRSFYIPQDDEDAKEFDGSSGLINRLKRAAGKIRVNGCEKKSIVDFRAAIDDYNKIMLRRLKSGKTLQVIKEQHILPDNLVAHILTQIYDRVITPDVDRVKAYTNGTDYVYGEMKNNFITEVLCTRLKMSSKQLFVDLGSGVGNVVLQAALQIGCESWGCEYMDNPATMADNQHQEFIARCELWGIQPGTIHLCHGDFTKQLDLPDLYKTLQRANVVLTNNKAFTPELNSNLKLIFLELQRGCRIVSLTDFSAASRHNTNDPAHTLKRAHEYKWPWKSVSWTDEVGPYYITSKK